MATKTELSCAACGSNRLSIPADGSDQDCVACLDCGAEVGTLGQLKAMVAQDILDRRKPA